MPKAYQHAEGVTKTPKASNAPLHIISTNVHPCRTAFKGPLKDDYVQAAGHYEAAVILWMQATDPAYYSEGKDAASIDTFRRTRVEESLAELDKVAKWETFVLDARIGMKLQTGLDTIKWLKGKKNWA